MAASDSESQRDLEVLLDEAKALRAEHDTRIGKQQDVTQLALAALAAVVALVAAQGRSGGLLDSVEALAPLLPLVSILLSGFTLMALDHDMNVVHIQTYLQKDLRYRIAAAVGGASSTPQEFWGWIAFRAGAQQHSGWWAAGTIGMAIAKYVATILPNLGVLIAFVAVGGGTKSQELIWVAFGAACVFLAMALTAAAYVGKAYLALEYTSPQHQDHDARPNGAR